MKKLFILVFAALGMLACTGQNDPSNPDNPINGELTGAFSVSKSQKVHFSQGNLQYQASTNTWRFAEHQWDTIGSANTNISDSYAGWIDLFGWGTSNNPTNTSTYSDDYSTFVDWGTNPIGNGGNEANMWRTLTSAEWAYLFNTRTNASTLWALGSVNGVNGAIVLPDNWVLPAGASFNASTQHGLVWWGDSYYRNYNDNNFSHNTYTAEQWAVMESAGAVFLPAAGSRCGTIVGGVGLAGYYESSTPSDADYDAYGFSFDLYNLHPQGKGSRFYGHSVRLVR